MKTLAKYYKKVRFYTRENVGAEDIHLPAEELDTQAFALTISEETAAGLGLTARPLPVAGDHDVRLVWRVARALRAWNAGLLHVHSRRGADTFGGVAARSIGVAAVLSRRVDNPLARWQAKALTLPYQRVVAISDAIATELIKAGVPPSRLAVIHDAVDTDTMVLSPDDDWFRTEFRLPHDVPVIGVVAQLIPRKGHADLLDALPLVLGEHPELRVIFFGRGPEEQALRMRAQARGLESVVHFAGFRDDLARILPCLDFIVHPAQREGMGVAVLEAQSAALPVVACRCGGISEVIEHRETGLLVEPGDRLALADAIRALLDDPEFSRELGVAGRRRMQEHFSLAAQAEQHVRLYESVLEDDT